jgi:hypothetical protein
MTKKTIYITTGIGASGLIIWAIALYLKSQKDKKATEFYEKASVLLNPSEDLATSDAFNQNYYKKVDSKDLLNKENADSYAKSIENSLSSWYSYLNDMDTIKSVFNSTANKSQISQISESYFNLFNTSLNIDLTAHCNESQYKEIMEIINRKS